MSQRMTLVDEPVAQHPRVANADAAAGICRPLTGAVRREAAGPPVIDPAALAAAMREGKLAAARQLAPLTRPQLARVAAGERDDQILGRPRHADSLMRAPLLRALVVCTLRLLRESAL